MDFLVEGVFTNIYVTIPAVLMLLLIYIYFVVSIYKEYMNYVDVVPSYREAINDAVKSYMFWFRNKDKIKEGTLETARIVYYASYSILWPINWTYHRFIVKDVDKGVARMREEHDVVDEWRDSGEYPSEDFFGNPVGEEEKGEEEEEEEKEEE